VKKKKKTEFKFCEAIRLRFAWRMVALMFSLIVSQNQLIPRSPLRGVASLDASLGLGKTMRTFS